MHNLSDRALKERIVGAVVLVLVAVLVVPIFLDGSSETDNTVRTSVTLPGQSSEGRQQQTIVLNRDRSEPVPTSRPATPLSSPSQADAAPQPVATEALVESTAESADKGPDVEMESVIDTEEEAAAPSQSQAESVAAPVEVVSANESIGEISETGMWAVQLGSFSSQANAEKLAAELRGQGYAAFLSQLKRNGAELHRVRIGPQKDRPSAESIATQLSRSGHKGQVVPHP